MTCAGARTARRRTRLRQLSALRAAEPARDRAVVRLQRRRDPGFPGSEGCHCPLGQHALHASAAELPDEEIPVGVTCPDRLSLIKDPPGGPTRPQCSSSGAYRIGIVPRVRADWLA